jgi:hypothetical protein
MLEGVPKDARQRPQVRNAPRRKRVLLASLMAVCLAAGTSAIAAVHAPDGTAARALRAPAPVAPADGTAVEAVPAFSWRSVKRAAKYEFQLSSDPGFRSTLASFDTYNTSASYDKTLFDGNYYWRVRAINSAKSAGRWSAVRSFRKRWTTQPRLLGPAHDADIVYPSTPLVLHWSAAPHAFKYEVTLSTDPTLAGNVLGDTGRPVEVVGTSYAVTKALAPGRYYWGVTSMDAGDLKGPSSEVGRFDWRWPSETKPLLRDLWDDLDSSTYVDPQFVWDPVPGAARYEVEINSSQDWALGSKVCCADPTIGTSLSPTKLFPNNTDLPAGQEGYHWRVRAIDIDGNAGIWNVGQAFRKAFDDVVPTVPSLRVRDNHGSDLAGGSVTSSPIVDWDPVPGASSYEVRVVPWSGGCDWNASSAVSWGTPQLVETSGTAWTPLAPTATTPVPFSGVANELDRLFDGRSYCARVRARAGTDTTSKRVVSDWTTLGGASGPAFTYDAPTVTGSSVPLTADDYVMPGGGETLRGMPLFTWKHVAGACGYFIAVAKDENFTAIVDVARTRVPAYAPRLRTYPDETTSYYWAVLPVSVVSGFCAPVFTTPQDNGPRTFQKRSNPPKLLGPAPGADLLEQPTFRWTTEVPWSGNWSGASAVEAAREYRLQVATDPNFANPIDDVKTASTSYTSSSTYPADTEMYWRVRANDENGTGLTWSTTGTFRRRLGRPEASADNPTRGQTFPVFSWSPVQGAVSYDLHIEEPDGDKRDFPGFRSTAASFIRLSGLGVFRWQVRANFPKSSFGTVPGAYTPMQGFDRFIEPPPGAHLSSDRKRVLLSWDPSRAAKKYKVEFSETNSFNHVLDTHTTENTNYAPRMNQPGFQDGGLLYWRVAALDEGHNVGGYAIGSLRLPRGMRVTLMGLLQKRRRGKVTVTVTTAKGRPIRGARVKVRGAGVRSRPRRTSRRGTVRLRLRPRRRGSLIFMVSKRGYRAGKASLTVR